MKEYSYIKRAIFRELCENSRISTTELAQKVKCSRNTVLSNMRALDNELGLFHTIEFNREATHTNYVQVWCVRFGNKPTTDELRKLFEDDYRARFVAETEGDFDLIVNVAADMADRYMNWSIRTMTRLLPYIPKMMPSAIILPHTGFFIVRNELLDKLDLSYLGIDEVDKKILLALNENSRMSFLEISKLVGANVETVRYRINKIMKRGVIRRFTTVLRRPPTEYNIAFFGNYEMAPGIRERYTEAMKYYITVDERLPLVNTFQYLSLTTGSHSLFGMGCFDSEEAAIKDGVMAHKEIYREDRPRINFARITNVIKGYLPLRSVDIAKDYRQIAWDPEKY
ncbi:MAG: AsnC family transcriptional regulator [Candidatus Micrarchaeota archaeon]|nr:AsnC family transcriptional regulator [Candidatus Micrarchaeota archaeon]